MLGPLRRLAYIYVSSDLWEGGVYVDSEGGLREREVGGGGGV